MIKLYTDATQKFKTTDCGLGILIIHNNKQTQLKFKIQANSNHEGEFLAAIKGFKEIAAKFKCETVFFYSDSLLVIDSLNKKYSKNFSQFLDDLINLQNQFELVVNQWIPEKNNKGAHNLALQAMKLT